MKTKTINSLLTLFVLFATLFISSCQDDDKPSTRSDEAKKEDVKKVLTLREDLNFVNRFVDKNVDLSSEGGRTSFARNIVSRLKNSAPCTDATEEELPDGSVKITTDFGDGCLTEDGVEVAGKVVMNFSFNDNSIAYSLEFIDYSEISGENQGEIANGVAAGSFTLDLEASEFVQEMEQDLVITYPDNTESAYKMAQAATMTEAGLQVTSLTTSGNFADGGVFAMTVTKTLVYDFACEGNLPVEGEELLTFQGNTILVNYGDGTCDNEFTVK